LQWRNIFLRLLDLFESAAHPGMVDTQMRGDLGDLIEAISPPVRPDVYLLRALLAQLF
jgi:hypothetical protein